MECTTPFRTVYSRLPLLRLGYQLAIYPATGFLAMGQALTKVYRNLSEAGHGKMTAMGKDWLVKGCLYLSINPSID
jgi:2-methylisocitrate lyase-like PEP mutase family enzyme